MKLGVSKLVAMSLVALMTIPPIASQATTYQYFRMYGGGQGGNDVVPPPSPAGIISYSVADTPVATVGTPFSATPSVAGAVGATTFGTYSGSFPPGLRCSGFGASRTCYKFPFRSNGVKAGARIPLALHGRLGMKSVGGHVGTDRPRSS